MGSSLYAISIALDMGFSSPGIHLVKRISLLAAKSTVIKRLKITLHRFHCCPVEGGTQSIVWLPLYILRHLDWHQMDALYVKMSSLAGLGAPDVRLARDFHSGYVGLSLNSCHVLYYCLDLMLLTERMLPVYMSPSGLDCYLDTCYLIGHCSPVNLHLVPFAP